MAFVIAALFGLYMLFHAPSKLDDLVQEEEALRKAVVTFNPPKRVVKVEDAPAETPKKITQVAEKKAVTTNPDPGKAGELRPSQQNKKVSQPSSTVDQGGAKKTGSVDGANMKSQTRDVRNEGLLSAFGSKGTQNQLSQAYSGTGELAGLADSASGQAGFAQDRAGDRLGSTLKNVGAGGKGTSTSGFSGVGTKGKGSGTFGYGSGGIGEKGKVDINIEGAGAEFSGTIDREAIRRVIRENRRSFKACYDAALRRNSDLYGRIEIQWDIVEGGRVQRALVKSNSVGDPALGQCIVTRLQPLRFPEPPADEIARVVYPFVFAAQ
jgi:outer membrane biosynthesis protein TonB